MRPVVNLGRVTHLTEEMGILGAIKRIRAIFAGVEGFGPVCMCYGRIYYDRCFQLDAGCKCGIGNFRTVCLKIRTKAQIMEISYGAGEIRRAPCFQF